MLDFVRRARRSSVALAGSGVVVVLALAALLFRGAEPQAPSVGLIGADGVCRAELDEYCTQKCPGYAQALQVARDMQPVLVAEAGKCGGLK